MRLPANFGWCKILEFRAESTAELSILESPSAHVESPYDPLPGQKIRNGYRNSRPRRDRSVCRGYR
jgi:hypothetical protein